MICDDLAGAKSSPDDIDGKLVQAAAGHDLDLRLLSVKGARMARSYARNANLIARLKVWAFKRKRQCNSGSSQ